ncbi:glycosyl hydrolase family 8 [Algibacillus agarilyticus]|uniref:glycosyl hydrolase family 8 n=1 Tax=Algibacillus agarilyticus TaxID=2234133 RepID=UPI000DD0C6A2|nr:glycosyl hydrolase family 8 [Algibacillus agarilyticus]
MKLPNFTLTTLSLCMVMHTASAQLLEKQQIENGTLLPGYTGIVASPFNGVAAYGNGDGAELTAALSNVPGQFRLDVRGASSANSAAGMSVYLGGKKIGGLSFSGTSPSVQSISFSLDEQPANSNITFKLESDNGSNDTFLDWYELHHEGDIPPPPPAPILPDEGSYDSGVYRNMFNELGYSQAEVKAKLNAVYDQLFHSTDLENEAIFIPVGDDMAYIWDVGNNDVRSEGMSYGMMMALQMDRKDDFDKLWKWANTYSLNKSGNNKGYFAWKVSTSGQIQDAAPAPDGEEYFVTALFFAAHRWGNGDGIYNYEAEANQILRDMFGNGETRYNNDGQLEEYSLFNHAEKQIVFSPATPTDRNWTDTSYHLPAFYELWAKWADNNNAFWSEIATVSRQHFKDAADPTTGLTPDYAYFDGTPHGDFQHWKDTFQYDAWRVISNVAMDYAWWQKDAWQVTQATRLQSFFKSEGVDSYSSLYELNGVPYENNSDHSPGLVAMNAVASLASNSSDAWEFVDALWNTPTPEGKYRYYDGCLYMFGMLAMSGEYRIYCPDGECDTVTTPVDPLPGGNNAPVANNDSATTDQDSSVTKNVVANDSDADGDVLSITTYSQAGNGSVSQNGNSLVYSPNGGYTGTDSFTYKVTDGTAQSNTATVNVTVNSTDTDPVDPVDPIDPVDPVDPVEGTELEFVQMESGVISPSYRQPITNPFAGAILYGNGEQVSFATNNLSAGDYTVVINGSSSNSSEAGISVYADNNKVGETSFSGTTRAEKSVSFTLSSSASTLTFKLESDVGQNDTLLDWYKLFSGSADGGDTTTPETPDTTGRELIPGTVQAEDFTSESGTQTENTQDNGGGLNVGYIQNGDNLEFAVNVATSGTYRIEARVASNTNGGLIGFLLNGSNDLGSVSVSNTGGWQNWQTVTTTVTLTAGNHTLKTNFTGSGNYLFNVNYFTFVKL